MRSTAILAAAVVAACSTPPRSDWQQVQRDRLDRMHRDRPLATALSEAIAARPSPDAQAPQEPLRIDQREPRLPGTGPRPFRDKRHPLVIGVGYGYGSVDMRVDGRNLDDRTAAQFARITVDAASGAGLHADAWFSDKDLFHGLRINDGVAPAGAEASLWGVDVFPHYRFDTGCGPLRAGVFAEWQQLDHDGARVQREFLSIGPRVAFEPTGRLFGDDAQHVALFGRLAADVGATWFTEEYRGSDDRDATWRWAGDAGAGLRAQLGLAHFELGYRWHLTQVQSIDSDLYGRIDRTDLQREQVFVGFGITY